MSEQPTSGLLGRRVVLVLATSTGGVGQHVRSLAGRLVADGVQVTVLGPSATQALFDFTGTGASFGVLEIGTAIRPVADTRAVRRLRRQLDRADLVHAHGLRAGLVAVLASTGRRAPLVVSWHNLLGIQPARRGPRRWLRRRTERAVERLVANGADLTLGASADLVQRARHRGARRAALVEVAAAPLPPPHRAPGELRAELGAADRPLIVAVGRLHPQKGYDVLVAAATRWRALAPPPLVAVAGSGPLQASLAAEVDRRRAPVRLLGRRDDVSDLLAAADLVVLPSRWEARSLVAQEAMRAGRALVTTAVGGLPELVGDAAVVVPPGQVDPLDAAVRLLLASPDRRAELGERAARRAAGWPSEGDTAAAVEERYRQLLAAGIAPGSGRAFRPRRR